MIVVSRREKHFRIWRDGDGDGWEYLESVERSCWVREFELCFGGARWGRLEMVGMDKEMGVDWGLMGGIEVGAWGVEVGGAVL